MSYRISQQQLESYLWGAATLLRGTIDAGDYKQFIFPLLFFKRLCDVFDEESQAALKESGGDTAFAAYPENHRFQIPQDAHWLQVREAAKNVGQALQSAMRGIETANPDKLYGIFGDAQWTNKDRLSDAMLRDLVEHFSSLELTIANLPEDELGQGYEYLIKKFADDSGHTAAEFYTNRTVVHLMTELLDVQPGESVYDPTCGSGGMLLSCISHLRRQGKEWRNVRLYGQERNLMTSSIARMNCFLHGIEDFRIHRGDTLSDPKFVQGDRLQRFDVVLANPPYSIKQWDREAFASDPWGRNLYGTPPQGRADFAFQQHIICSMSEQKGRSIVLWPHGLLSREEEAEIRKKLVATDLVEAVIGLGRKLFYNSGMESCLFVCRHRKTKNRKGKILFVNAENFIQRERAQSFLSDSDISSILKAYRSDKPIPEISAFATNQEVLARNANLNIKLYVATAEQPHQSSAETKSDLRHELRTWLSSSSQSALRLADVLPELQPQNHNLQIPAGLFNASLFDRSKWKRVTLGDVATEYAERVDNPSSSGFERYIGSDCIDQYDFRLQRWDAPSSVSSSMKAFRKGDYLLVRRSLYGSDFRERAPRADFEGICSADILTIRENPHHIANGFLIGVLYSQKLWQHVVAHAKGSLTRRIKWRELENFEFDLPPLDQQCRISEILWAAEAVTTSWQGAARAAETHRRALITSLYENGLKKHPMHQTALGPRPSHWEVLPLQAKYAVQLGKKLYEHERKGPFPRPYLRNANVQWNALDLTEVDRMSFSPQETAKYELRYGDILACEGRHVGKSAMWRNEIPGACYQMALHRIRRKSDDQIPEYLLHHMQYSSWRGLFAVGTGATTIPHLPAEALKQIPFSFPPQSEQKEIAARVTSLDSAITQLRQTQHAARETLKSLVETLLFAKNDTDHSHRTQHR